MSTFSKINSLLSKKDKLRAFKLFVLMMFGMLLEIAGVGLIIPILALINNNEMASNNIYFSKFLELINSFENISALLVAMIFFGLFYMFKALYLIYLSWEQSKFVFLLQAKLSNNLFLGYLKNPYTFHLQKNSAELHRNVDETADIAAGVSACAIFVSESLVLIGILILLLAIEPVGTLIVVMLFILASSSLYFFTKNALHNYGFQRHHNESHRLRHLKHGLNGIKIIKAFGFEVFFADKFSYYVNSIAKVNKKQTVVKGLPKILLEVITVLSLVFLVSVLTIQGQSNSEIITVIAVFGAAAFRLTPSFNKLIGSAQSLKYVSPVINTLYQEFHNLNFLSSLDEFNHESSYSSISFNSKIDINNISLSYPDSEVLIFRDLSLVINFGDMVGITGESGSGKSSLIDAIMGLIPVKRGSICVDSNNIIGNLSQWQKNIGYVPQDIFLIDDTISSNIAFGVDAGSINEDALNSAIKQASLSSFIDKLPQGVGTIVGENGVRLSGGQRQRIGIARALYNDPALLIFDEATSALDMETEKKIMDTVYKISTDRTLLIITHRINTLENCNKVYVLENGSLRPNPHQ
jgi:ABC-type multidrug transport system fused ATPase/permease subunit